MAVEMLKLRIIANFTLITHSTEAQYAGLEKTGKMGSSLPGNLVI